MKNASSSMARLLALAALLPLSVLAGPAYQITIDTSLFAASDGAIYLQFNPGSGVASVTINPFSAGTGTLGLGVGSGDFLGDLVAPPLILTNTWATNDYLQFMTFGDQVSFTATFDYGSPSSAVFSFAATGPDGLTPILIVDPLFDYFLGDIAFDEEGLLLVNNYSPDFVTITNAIPEPSTLGMLAAGLALAVARFRQRR